MKNMISNFMNLLNAMWIGRKVTRKSVLVLLNMRKSYHGTCSCGYTQCMHVKGNEKFNYE